MNSFKEKLKNKLKATFIHFLISLVIFSFLLYFIIFDWYPEPFFTAQGGWQGIRLMALVDLVLGPSLTFIVFNHLKQRKAIVLDLSVIAVFQIAALIWGGLQVYTQRPVALVFWSNSFYTVTSDDYSDQGIDNPDFSQYSSHVPPLVFVRSPADLLELEASRQLTEKSIPIYAQTSLYESIEDNLEVMFLNQVDIEEVIAKNSEMKSQLVEITDGDITSYKYLGLKAKFQNMILIMKENGDLLGEVKAPYYN